MPSDGSDARGSASRDGHRSRRSRRERPAPPPDWSSSASGVSALSSSNSQETQSSASRRSNPPIRPRDWAMIPYQDPTVQPSSQSDGSESTLVIEAPPLPRPSDNQTHHYSDSQRHNHHDSQEYYRDGDERRRRSRSRRRDGSYSRRHDHPRSTEQGHPYIHSASYSSLPGRYHTDFEDEAYCMTSGSYWSYHVSDDPWSAESSSPGCSHTTVIIDEGRRRSSIHISSSDTTTINLAPMGSSGYR